MSGRSRRDTRPGGARAARSLAPQHGTSRKPDTPSKMRARSAVYDTVQHVSEATESKADTGRSKPLISATPIRLMRLIDGAIES